MSKRTLAAIVVAAGLVAAPTAARADDGHHGHGKTKFTVTVLFKESDFHVVDADQSGDNSVGDYAIATGSLRMGHRVVGSTWEKSVLTGIEGSVYKLHSTQIYTLRHHGKVVCVFDESQDQSQAPEIGATQREPVVAGSGEFEHARGVVVSALTKLVADYQTTRDTFYLQGVDRHHH